MEDIDVLHRSVDFPQKTVLWPSRPVYVHDGVSYQRSARGGRWWRREPGQRWELTDNLKYIPEVVRLQARLDAAEDVA